MNKRKPKEKLENCYVCIVAGGRGTRLYPISNPLHEKQFCYVSDGVEFIADTVNRFVGAGIDPQKIIIVVTSERQRDLAKDITLKLGVISPNIIIIDPDHGYVGAMADGTFFAESIKGSKDPVVIATPADQYIDQSNGEFKKAVHQAYISAKAGYPTIVGVTLRDLSSFMGCGHAIYGKEYKFSEDCVLHGVNGFIEKPSDRKKADQLMRSNTTACNTGINAWTPSMIRAAIGDKDPYEMSTDELMDGFGNKLRVITGKFDWYDCGTFSSYYQVLNHDANDNAFIGDGDSDSSLSERCLISAGKKIHLRTSNTTKESIVAEYVGDILVVMDCAFNYSQKVKRFADDWCGVGGEILNSIFTIDAPNNHVRFTNMKGKAVVGFLGVSNHMISMYEEDDRVYVSCFGPDKE